MNGFEPFMRMYRWFDALSITEAAAVIFTIITVTNSFMMVFGWDQPKEGAFAYIHLLTRLAIITAAIVLWDFQEIMRYTKTWLKRRMTYNHRRRGSQFTAMTLRMAGGSHVSKISILFTAVTFSVSIVSIIFQEIIEPEGGVELYRNLLMMFGVLVIGLIASTIYRKKIIIK